MLATLTTFAQDMTYTYVTPTDVGSDGSGGISATYVVIYLLIAVVSIVSMWKIYTKAKQPGWAAIVPIYNAYILLKIVGRPWWWLLLLLIPIVNIIVGFVVAHDLSKSFGQGVGMTLLLILVSVVGYPLLAFGNYEYKGPAALADGGTGSGTGAAPTTPTAPTPPAAPVV